MRIVAFIEEPRVVSAILEHLSLWDEPRGGLIFTGRRRGGGLRRDAQWYIQRHGGA